MDVITDFLRSEIDTKEHYEKIIHFITSYEIRKGKFKGNKYIIEKINRDSFMLYIEYQDIQGKIMYTSSIAPIISQNRLIEFIEEYKKWEILWNKTAWIPGVFISIAKKQHLCTDGSFSRTVWTSSFRLSHIFLRSVKLCA